MHRPLEAARAEAETRWAVSAERPLASFAKRALRRLLRFYVEPLAADQRAFNASALKLADALSEHVDEIERAAAETARLVRELDERLLRLERRTPAGTVAAQPRATALPDYFAFEARMRAPTEELRRRQAPYVADFRGAAPVLDVGCGRGEFLALLREAGIGARGVDADADMVAFARGQGLEVEQADAIAYLERLEDASLGGIFAAQVLEHLPPPALLRLLELAAAKLRPNGLLVAETINPLSPLALRNFFADLTHAQPLVPETLVLLARHAGFREIETRFLNEPAERLPPELSQVQALLYAPLDYAIVART
jgi:O-antigen chain-terminating methyltransferase